MVRKQEIEQQQAGAAGTPDPDPYRSAVASMARALVAAMFDHHATCQLRECRAAGHCRAGAAGGFCAADIDERAALAFAGMMAFHDVFRDEILAGEAAIQPVPVRPASVRPSAEEPPF